MANILDEVLKHLPEDANISEALFEGANIVLYTKNKNFLFNTNGVIKSIVDDIKKRVELRPDPSLCMDMEDAKKVVEEIIPKEAAISEIIFDVQRSRVIIEAEKPGIAIGKQGELLKEIKKKTLWIPLIKRTPAIRSKLIENIRHVLYENDDFRKKFLHRVGKRIYDGWKRERKNEWVRVTFLGASRQVGRSCFLLQTPESRVLLDCGIDVAASGTNQFPYLDAPEFNINDLDAVVITHPHVDHVGLLPYLYKMGYDGPAYMSVDYKEPIFIRENGKIKKVNIGEFIDKALENPRSIEKLPFYDYSATTPVNDIEAAAFSTLDYKINFKKIQKVIRHKICDGDSLYKIHVKTGRNITVTGSHSIFILSDSEIKEAKVSEINIGDYLVVPHKLPTTEIKEVDIKNILSEFKHDENFIYLKQGKKIPRYLTLSRGLMRILGYFTAEGNFDRRSLQFTFGLKDVSYIKQLENDVETVFGVKPKTHISKETRLRVNVNSVLIKELFLRFFFKDHTKALTKRVPEIMFNVSNELKLEFLKAYFNGDGTINYHNYTAIAVSVSKELISDLTYLCSQIGISYHIYERYMTESAKTKNKVYQLMLNFREFFNSKKICRASSNIIPLKETRFNEDWYYHRLKTKLHVTKERLISLINSNIIKYKDTMQIKDTLFKLANSDLAFLPVTKIEKVEPTNGYVYDISVDGDQNFVAGETPVCLHNTAPTRDIGALLCLDLIGIAQKEAEKALYSATDIKNMVKHTICLDFEEVSDITPDVRLTFYNAGHNLGSAMAHLHIGNGLHNLLYAGDFNFENSNLLSAAATRFPRLETAIMEGTYGGKDDIVPSRKESEVYLLEIIKNTVARGGKVLMPVLGVGRSQEVMLIIERAMREGLIPKIPVYIQGMVWEVTAIHTTYPDFFNSKVKRNIFHRDENPFLSDIFKKVGSQEEMRGVIESGESCIIMATSGMMQGGPALEYFRHLAENPKHSLILTCYQGEGSFGRRLQNGERDINLGYADKPDMVYAKIEVHIIRGFSGHSSRNALLNWVHQLEPRPKKIIVVHGESSKCLDLASSIHRIHRIETAAPKNLEVIRIK